MPRRRELDRWLLAATLVTVAFGVVMVASASAPLAREYYRLGEREFAFRQLVAVTLGVVGLLVATFVPLERLMRVRIALPLLLVTWGLLVLALLQSPVAGTHRWVRLLGFSFQPSALAKITLPLALAALLGRGREGDEDRSPGFLAPLALAGVTTALVLVAPDLGSSMLLLAIAMSVLLLAGLPWRLILATAVATGSALSVTLALNPYQLKRLLDFFGQSSHQVQQSLIALGGGGILGRGPGNSLQKLFFLPQPHTDFIFAVVGEEFGMLGSFGTLTMLGLVVSRGLRAARRASTPATALLAIGLATGIAVQALLNVSVCLHLMPAKGLPLPLISAGGSDVAVTLVAIGLLLNVAKEGV